MIFKKLLVCSLMLLPFSAIANPLRVVTTTPDLAWMAREIGKDKVAVSSLLSGVEDYHYVDAVPEFIRLVAEADVVCAIGLDLEMGWLPRVLERSGNAKVQTGGLGHCEVGKSVDVLEKPEGNVDRSMGDVHPGGNPHFWVSPKYFLQAGRQMLSVFTRVLPEEMVFFNKNFRKLEEKLELLEKESGALIQSVLKQKPNLFVMEYHREFSYFFQTYRFKSFGTIEEKPGVPPSAGRLGQVAISAKAAGVKLVIAAKHHPHKTLDRFQEMSGIPYLQLAVSVKREGEGSDYIEHHRALVKKIVEKLK